MSGLGRRKKSLVLRKGGDTCGIDYGLFHCYGSFRHIEALRCTEYRDFLGLQSYW